MGGTGGIIKREEMPKDKKGALVCLAFVRTRTRCAGVFAYDDRCGYRAKKACKYVKAPLPSWHSGVPCGSAMAAVPNTVAGDYKTNRRSFTYSLQGRGGAWLLSQARRFPPCSVFAGSLSSLARALRIFGHVILLRMQPIAWRRR